MCTGGWTNDTNKVSFLILCQVVFKIDFLGQLSNQKSVIMSANSCNQNMGSWTSKLAMSENDFPCLNKKSSGRKVIKLVVPLKTYEDELREKFESRPVLENNKTRMCNSIDANQVCRHGDQCRFAHSLDELVIRDCHFKDRCHFVKIRNGKLFNDGSNTCRNKHPCESREDFIKRTGLSRYKTNSSNHEEIDVEDDVKEEVKEEVKVKDKVKIEDKVKEEVKIEEVKEVKDKVKEVKDKVKEVKDKVKIEDKVKEEVKIEDEVKEVKEVPAQEPPPTFKFGGSCEKEIILRVPRVLALQALEIAMNSGNRCIRVEVIE